MKQEVATQKVQLPANFAARLATGIAESRARTVINAGGKPLLRLLKSGEWVFGQGDEEVQDGSRWLINVATIGHGYCCWIDSSLRGEVMTSVFDHKPDQPPPIDGQPYKEQRAFELKCFDGEDAGTEVLYKTSSLAGMQASDKLFATLQSRAAEDQVYIFPLVRLGSGYYEHKKHGRIYTPVLEIVGWLDQNGQAPSSGNGKAASSEETMGIRPDPEQARPQRTRKAAIGDTPAGSAPQTTQQAHAGQRRRPGR